MLRKECHVFVPVVYLVVPFIGPSLRSPGLRAGRPVLRTTPYLEEPGNLELAGDTRGVPRNNKLGLPTHPGSNWSTALDGWWTTEPDRVKAHLTTRLRLAALHRLAVGESFQAVAREHTHQSRPVHRVEKINEPVAFRRSSAAADRLRAECGVRRNPGARARGKTDSSRASCMAGNYRELHSGKNLSRMKLELATPRLSRPWRRRQRNELSFLCGDLSSVWSLPEGLGSTSICEEDSQRQLRRPDHAWHLADRSRVRASVAWG